MNKTHRHTKTRVLLPMTIFMAIILAVSSCRRDLWVYTDEFRQVELFTDWTKADKRPTGMTWWFMNDDRSGQNRHETTAEIAHTWLNLPRGQYTGVVFDYSPAEYSHVEFVNMSNPDSALVRVRPSAYQPQAGIELFGDSAVKASMTGIGKNDATNLHIVAAEPEIIHADTIKEAQILSGISSDLIPYKERDNYMNTLVTTTLYANPKPIVWKLNIRVYVRGINHMYSVRGTVAGLADGCWLGTLRHTSTSCLQLIEDWQAYKGTDSIGYIYSTVNTFGLPDAKMPPAPATKYKSGTKGDGEGSGSVITIDDLPLYNEELQLNLEFLLRDGSTVMNYHFLLGDEAITIREDELIVNIDIPIDDPDKPDLPYVQSSDESGFDAKVTPWVEEPPTDIIM